VDDRQLLVSLGPVDREKEATGRIPLSEKAGRQDIPGLRRIVNADPERPEHLAQATTFLLLPRAVSPFPFACAG
jgi:hypothetical protein